MIFPKQKNCVLERILYMRINKAIRYRFEIKEIIGFCLVIYLCTCTGHKSGQGFDAFICRLAFVILAAAECLKLIYAKKLSLRKSFFWYLGFVFLYYLSILWAKDMGAVLSPGIFNNFIQILGVTLIIEDNFSTQNDFVKLFKYILIAILYMVFRLVWKTPLSMWGTDRVGGAIALNANTVGVWSATAVMITLFLGRSNKKYFILTFLLLFIAMMSGSRKAFIIAVCEVFLYFLCKDRNWKFVLNLILSLLSVALLLFIVFKIPFFYNVIGIRVERAVRTLLGLKIIGRDGSVMREYSSWERSFFRQQGYQMFWQKPLLGWGGNHFQVYMGIIGYWNRTYSHCNYVEILSSLGLVGFIYYYGYLFYGLIKGMIRFIEKYDFLVLCSTVILMTNLIIQYFMVSYYEVVNTIIVIVCMDVIFYCKKSQEIN